MPRHTWHDAGQTRVYKQYNEMIQNEATWIQYVFNFLFCFIITYTFFIGNYYTVCCTQHRDNDMAMTTQQHATTRLPRYIQHDNFKLTWCRRRLVDAGQMRAYNEESRWYRLIRVWFLFFFISFRYYWHLFERYYYSMLHPTPWQWHNDDKDSTTCHDTSTMIHLHPTQCRRCGMTTMDY